MSQVAQRTNPRLWEACKKQACAKAKLCVHSARKMQWAVRCYKSKGGGYVGQKSSKNRLARWTRQRWRTHDGSKSGGKKRYLPALAWKDLSQDQIRRTNVTKSRGHRRGEQYVRQPADVVAAVRRHRTR